MPQKSLVLNEANINTQPMSELFLTILSLFETTEPQTIATTIIPHYSLIMSRLRGDMEPSNDSTLTHLIILLIDIFMNGTTKNLYLTLSDPKNVLLFTLITPKLYSNLQLLTFITVLEHVLLSPEYLDCIPTQVAFSRVPFDTIATEINSTHCGKQLLDLFKTHSSNNQLLSHLSAHPTITLITSSFSTKLLVGVLHDVMNDSEGILEVRNINVRSLFMTQDSTVINSTTVTIDEILDGFDVLISAVEKTAQII